MPLSVFVRGGAVCAAAIALGCGDSMPARMIPEPGEPAAPTQYTLVWSDEFAAPGLPDSTKWAYDVGDGCPNLCGWGNNELQHYTARRSENARVEGGHLIVEARKESFGTRGYTSARLGTKGKGD